MQIADIFYCGNYKSVLAATIDSRAGDCGDEDLPFVIGALTFRGRLQEAETLFRLRSAGFCPIARAAARFYLGVGYCRISEYERARGYFAQNLLDCRRRENPMDPVNPKIRFFAWQGVGFFRLFFGRY